MYKKQHMAACCSLQIYIYIHTHMWFYILLCMHVCRPVCGWCLLLFLLLVVISTRETHFCSNTLKKGHLSLFCLGKFPNRYPSLQRHTQWPSPWSLPASSHWWRPCTRSDEVPGSPPLSARRPRCRAPSGNTVPPIPPPSPEPWSWSPCRCPQLNTEEGIKNHSCHSPLTVTHIHTLICYQQVCKFDSFKLFSIFSWSTWCHLGFSPTVIKLILITKCKN